MVQIYAHIIPQALREAQVRCSEYFTHHTDNLQLCLPDWHNIVSIHLPGSCLLFYLIGGGAKARSCQIVAKPYRSGKPLYFVGRTSEQVGAVFWILLCNQTTPASSKQRDPALCSQPILNGPESAEH